MGLNEMSPAQGEFESLRLLNEHGAEYWRARDLQPLMGYTQWRRFEQAIERATASCEASGNQPVHHFAGAGNMVELGSGSQRAVNDYHFSRFAGYNGLYGGLGRDAIKVRKAIPAIGGTCH